MSDRIGALVVLTILTMACGTTSGQTGQPRLPIVELSAGVHLIKAEVAATPATRAQGLMFRSALELNHGMLFVFPDSAAHCMWMKNTKIPLSVAFIDDAGRIVSISDMTPHDEASHCATRPARYALEMSQGWFEGKSIKPGVRIGGLNRAGDAR